MVSPSVSGSTDLSSSSSRGHCVLSLGKTLSLTVPLSSQVYKWVPASLMLGEQHFDGVASNPEEIRNTPSVFMFDTNLVPRDPFHLTSGRKTRALGASREAFCLRVLHKKYFNVSNRWYAPTLRVSKMATNLSVMEVVFLFFPFVT